MALTGKPIIISTGVAQEKDITNAINFLKKMKLKKLYYKNVTHPTSSLKDSNLSSINYLKKNTEYRSVFQIIQRKFNPNIVGWLRICMIEKHFNIDNNKSLDSFFSSNPNSFSQLIKNIRILEREIAFKKYKISKRAKENRSAMRSIYISKNVKKNEVISASNISIVRPSYGLSTIYFDRILGKKFKGSYKMGERMCH